MQNATLPASRHAALPCRVSTTPALARLRRRGGLAPPCAQQKGFGDASGQQQKSGQQVKVSKRGKTASRPSPELTLKQLQADEAAYRAQLEAAPQGQQQQQAAADPDPDLGSQEAIPQAVSDRMLLRIVVCAGTPVFLGMSLLPLFYWIKIKEGIDLPTWVVYIVQTLTFGGGLAGITYGAMSASWDPRREGSLLGWTEFQANLPLLLDRFRRK